MSEHDYNFCITGVYFEKILKGADISVWMRNVQLSVVAIPIGLLTTFSYDYAEVSSRGFFYGYNAIVWSVILLQALGGLLVAMVVRYADNILKVANSLLLVQISLYPSEITLLYPVYQCLFTVSSILLFIIRTKFMLTIRYYLFPGIRNFTGNYTVVYRLHLCIRFRSHVQLLCWNLPRDNVCVLVLEQTPN